MEKIIFLIVVTCIWSSVAHATVIELNQDGTVTTHEARDYLANMRYDRIKPEVHLYKGYRKPKDNFNNIINDAAEKYAVDTDLIHAIIKTESQYDPNALSSKGAQGLMQIMPGTAQYLGIKNPFDPTQNIDGGTRYIKYLIDKFDGDLSIALAAYNAGEGTIRKFGGIPPYPETIEYIKKIERIMKKHQ